MGTLRVILNPTVAAFGLMLALAAAAWGQGDRLPGLLEQLQEPELPNWAVIEEEIRLEWSKSGSPAMDLLLQRGRTAMEEQEYETALEHLSALTDHAPEFAEGFNARATAYFHLGLFGPALADLQQVLTLNPQHFGALFGLGAIMEEIGKDDLALRAYEAARDIHPHEPDLQDAIERLDTQVRGVTL